MVSYTTLLQGAFAIYSFCVPFFDLFYAFSKTFSYFCAGLLNAIIIFLVFHEITQTLLAFHGSCPHYSECPPLFGSDLHISPSALGYFMNPLKKRE